MASVTLNGARGILAAALVLAAAGPARGGEAGGAPTVLSSDAGWSCATSPNPAWMEEGFPASGWAASVVHYDGDPSTPYAHLSPENVFGFPTQARWMWAPGDWNTVEVWFRRSFHLERVPARAELVLMADDVAELFVNSIPAGRAATDCGYWASRGCARLLDVTPWLRRGTNVLALAARDNGGCRGLLVELRLDATPLRTVLAGLKQREAPAGVNPRYKGGFKFAEWKFENLEIAAKQPSPDARNYTVFLWNAVRLAVEDRAKVLEILSRNLDTADEALRTETAASLLLLDAREAAADLAPFLKAGAPGRMSLLVAQLLRRTRDPAFLPVLRETLKRLEPPDAGAVGAWVAKLGDPDFREREEAQRRLLQIGEAAIPGVQEALESDDLEIRLRATRILQILLANESLVFKVRLRAFLGEILEEAKTWGAGEGR